MSQGNKEHMMLLGRKSNGVTDALKIIMNCLMFIRSGREEELLDTFFKSHSFGFEKCYAGMNLNNSNTTNSNRGNKARITTPVITLMTLAILF